MSKQNLYLPALSALLTCLPEFAGNSGTGAFFMLGGLSQGRPKSSLSHTPTYLFLVIESCLCSHSRGHACPQPGTACFSVSSCRGRAGPCTEAMAAFWRPEGPHQGCHGWIHGVKHPGSTLFDVA